jgi:hypothetical protein
MLEAASCHRNRHGFDSILAFVEKAVSVFPRGMNEVDYVGRNLAPVTSPIEQNLRLGAPQLDGSPQRADARLELREQGSADTQLSKDVLRWLG